MQPRSERGGIRAGVVLAAGVLVALVLVGHNAFGVGGKIVQTQVLGRVFNCCTVFNQVVNGSDKSPDARAAEANAAAVIKGFGQCASSPRIISKTKTFEVVQINGVPCGGGGLSCNGTGRNGATEDTQSTSKCGTTTTQGEEQGFG